MKKLPSWFDLGKYDVFLQIKNFVLIQQVEYRCYLLFFVEPENEEHRLQDWYEQVSSGIVHLYNDGSNLTSPSYRQYAYERFNVKPGMDELRYVYPTNVNRLAGLSEMVQEEINLTSTYLGHASVSDVVAKRARLVDAQLNAYVEMHLTIDLSGSDKEILRMIATLLPEWRKHLNFAEPSRTKNERSAETTIKKIIEYKILPMLDLLLWCKLQSIEKYTVPFLSQVLFQDLPAPPTAKQMHETHLIFLDSLKEEEFSKTMDTWLADEKNANRLVKTTCGL